jgi:excisionase family DNA binding protein
MSATQRRLVTPPSQSVEPLLLSAQDAFRLIGLGRDSGYELIAQGRLRSIRLGRRVLVSRAECEAFVQRESASGIL